MVATSKLGFLSWMKSLAAFSVKALLAQHAAEPSLIVCLDSNPSQCWYSLAERLGVGQRSTMAAKEEVMTIHLT